MRDLREPTRRVEARGKVVGDRLIVDKAVRVRRTDGLFVKTLSIELAALYARDLRARQCGAVFEIVGAILCPYCEQPVVSRQGLEMLLSLVGRRGIGACGVRKRAIEVILRRFEESLRCPE